MLLGELLIQKKLLTKSQLDTALEEQKATRDFLGAILVRRRMILEQDLMRVLSEQFRMPCLELKPDLIDWTVAMRFTPSLVVDHLCLPFKQDDSGVTIAIANPLDAEAVSRCEEQVKGTRVKPVLVSMADIQRALKAYNERMADRIKKLLE